ncbi:hypothetical protein V8C40DRAFT_276463 [Trichoderma camerunense]
MQPQASCLNDDDGRRRVHVVGSGKMLNENEQQASFLRREAALAYPQGIFPSQWLFFFSRSSGDLSSTRKFVATIANELAESLPAYREHLHNALDSSPTITSRSLYDQWEKLILNPLRSTSLEDDVQPILIVIDALDECDSEHDQGVLIQCLAELSALEKIPFRIFITNRPQNTIHLGFDRITSYSRQDFTLHEIEESIVAADLRLYYRHEITGMDIDQSLITEENIDSLARKSDRLFIHAATVCRFIRQGEIYAVKRLQNVLASQDSQLEPERELDSIYTTVLKTAFAKFASLQSGETETLRMSYQKVVGSIVMLYDRMPPTDFATLVGEPVENVTRLLKYLSSVLDVPREASGQIYVLHASFRDFLSDPQRSSSLHFSIDYRKIHASLLQRCIDIMAIELRKNICRLREPGKRTKDISASDVDNHISQVLQYACKYWIYHLQQSNSHKDTRRYIHNLLTGITRNIGRGGTKVNHQTLAAVVQDATRFLYAHSPIIDATPMQLYISALIFSPRTSLIRRIYQHHIPSWILSIPSLSESWNPQLRQLYYPSWAQVIAYSSDGKFVASGHNDSKICLWDATTGAQRRVLTGHSRAVVSLSFSPNSSLLVAMYRRIHEVRQVAFMPDGKRIVFTKLLGSIYLWDIIENKEVWVSRCSGNDSYKGYRDMKISPDGKRIACGNGNHKKNVWLLDTENGNALHNAKRFDEAVESITFSPDSKLLAVAFYRNFEIWNVDTFLARWKKIAIAVWKGIKLLNMTSGKEWCELQDTNMPDHGMPQRFAFSPDGSAIASVSGDNGVTVWDTRFRSKYVDSELPFESPDYEMLPFEYPSVVAALRDDYRLASASYSDAIRLWDGQTGAKRELYIHRLHPLVDMLSITPAIASAGKRLIFHLSITFSIDGKFFACVWKTKKLQVWDAHSGKMLFARKLNPSTSDNVLFSPDSKLIASVSDKIYFWNAKTGSEAYSSEAPLGKVESISFSPDGKYLVSSIPTKNRHARFDDMMPSVHDNGDFYGYTHISITVEYKSLFQFSSNGRLLAYLFGNRIIVLILETRYFLFISTLSRLKKLSIFDNNRYLGALQSFGGHFFIFIWELVTGSVVYKGRIDTDESSLCFSLNGKHIASLDKIFAYKTSLSANCHSTGISFTGVWIKDGGQDIVYFPHECKDLFDFLSGSALVFRWPPTGFFGQATQYMDCNMLQFAMVNKVMDED